MSITARLLLPNTRKVALVESTAGQHLYFWTADGSHSYYASTAYRVVGVRENGGALNPRSSASAVDATAGTYWWDQANGRVYVHPTGSVSAYTKTYQAVVRFDFASQARVIDGRYYEGRILSLPSVSMRIEPTFGDPGQIGAGAVTFANGDGFFDALSDLQWDAGETTLKLGVDGVSRDIDTSGPAQDGVWADPAQDGVLLSTDGGAVAPTAGGSGELVYGECDYSDYATLGAWRNSGWSKKDGSFSLSLEEKKGSLKKKIPFDLYDRTDYPNMEENQVGEVIPWRWGTVYDVRPTCIDIEARQFHVAAHPIKEFLGARVRKLVDGAESETWVDVNFATRDTATATFTLSEDDWDGQSEVAVDFRGRMNGDGSLMVNAADVVKDILVNVLLEPEGALDSASFASARSALRIGTDAEGAPVVSRAVSLDLAEATEATGIISRINACVGSYFFNGYDGKYKFVVFDPVPGEGLLSFDESEIQSLEEVTDAEEIFTSVRAGYQYRAQQDYPQVYACERASSQYLQGASSPVLKDLENLPLSELDDARYVAQRTARMDGERLRKYKVRVSAKAWEVEVTDAIHLSYARHGIDGVFEVLEVKQNLERTLWVDLVVGAFHGMADTVGFWMPDSPTFPSRLGGGSCAAWDSGWTDAQKAWARQNCGYWTDENGFADSSDPDSYLSGSWF